MTFTLSFFDRQTAFTKPAHDFLVVSERSHELILCFNLTSTVGFYYFCWWTLGVFVQLHYAAPILSYLLLSLHSYYSSTERSHKGAVRYAVVTSSTVVRVVFTHLYRRSK